jgi:hypothetical protein
MVRVLRAGVSGWGAWWWAGGGMGGGGGGHGGRAGRRRVKLMKDTHHPHSRVDRPLIVGRPGADDGPSYVPIRSGEACE